jgi:DNA-binding transcriptional MerR regulator
VSARRPEDLLEPVDVLRNLRRLELTLGQVCRVAGVSKMQLDYWTTKARIPTKGKKQRLYTLDAVETVMLIKQGKDKGLSLQAAIEAAERFKAAKGTAGPAAQLSK